MQRRPLLLTLPASNAFLRRAVDRMACWLVVGIFLAAPSVRVHAELPGSPDADGHFAKLVDALGDSSFAVRETAAAQLGRAGSAARPALLGAAKHADLEVQLRAAQLLARIENNEFQLKIAKFLADVGGDADYGLPGWKPYRAIVHDDREAREFFAEMLESEPELMKALDPGSAELAPTVVTDRIRWFQTRAMRSGYQNTELTPANVAALLLASSELHRASRLQDSPNSPFRLVQSQLYSMLNLHSARNAVFAGRGSRQVLGLLENWIHQTSDPSTAYFGLQLAIRYDFQKTGRKVAQKTLENGSTNSSALSHAAIALGRFGEATDVALLERHFTNETVCHTWSNRRIQKEPIRIQTRDVALAMAIHLTEQDVKSYGFEFANPNASTVFDIYTLGFLNDEQRAAGFEKWRQWKQQKEKADEP